MKVQVGDRVVPTIYPDAEAEADWMGEVVEINPDRYYSIRVKHDKINVIWDYHDGELDLIARAVVLRGKRPLRLAGNNHRFTVTAGQRLAPIPSRVFIHYLGVR